jgi:2-dehydropantoate 2-reductase
MVPFNVTRLGEGHFRKTTKGRVVVEDDPLLHGWFDGLSVNPFSVDFTDDIVAIQWSKLLLNLNNPLHALSGLSLRAELSDRAWRQLLAASIREALAVMARAGIQPRKISALPPSLLAGFIGLPDVLFNSIGLRLQGIDEMAGSSMADDFAAGRKTEIDHLNGEIVRLAANAGVDAPVNRAILRIVHEAEAGGRRQWDAPSLAGKIMG